MSKFNDNLIMPPSVDVVFRLRDHTIQAYPLFLFLLLARRRDPQVRDSDLYKELSEVGDRIADQLKQDDHVRFITEVVPWEAFAPFVVASPDTHDAIRKAWRAKGGKGSRFGITFQKKKVPPILYRYMPFRADRVEPLLSKGNLYLPSPSQFNDPFDCSLDDSIRLTFIECGVGCFSEVKDDVLMFSHYADHHRGLCVGFNAIPLVSTLQIAGGNDPMRGDLRPVRYFSRMPPLDLTTQPALCATCKHDIWQYEKEFRLFAARGSSLLPAGVYQFDRTAVAEIVMGCRSTDDSIAFVKNCVSDLPNCQCFKAFLVPNQFGVQCRQIARL